MKELYQGSADFKRYVDRYCNSYGCTVEEALGHALVREVSTAYRSAKVPGDDFREHVMQRFMRVG